MRASTDELLVVRWQRTQDERERAIFAAATTVGFLATMLVVAGFVILDAIADEPAVMLTPTWILVTGVVAWGGSMFALRGECERACVTG